MGILNCSYSFIPHTAVYAGVPNGHIDYLSLGPRWRALDNVRQENNAINDKPKKASGQSILGRHLKASPFTFNITLRSEPVAADGAEQESNSGRDSDGNDQTSELS
jgi:hypothetical protein